jgi:DNA-binding MarR family transcriptional regulator
MLSNLREDMTAAKATAAARGFALWREAMRWQRNLDSSLGPHRLTHTQYLVLVAADGATEEAKDAVTQRAVAERAGLDEVTTSRVVRLLADRGLLDRGPSTDRRAYRIVVTQKGRQLVRRAAPDVEVAAKRFFAERRPG